MAEDWSDEEVAATVADYFAMLQCELRGESYNKRDHNRRLQRLLSNRSAGAIEFKHQNISAILVEEGFPPIDGYKPRVNYQERLRVAVVAQLFASPNLLRAAAVAVSADVAHTPSTGDWRDIMVPPPVRERRNLYERVAQASVIPRLGVNYLERESRNTSLGAAGEEFVLALEHRRLWEAGARHLAERIEHVAKTQGDGLGYDIASFELDGRECLIEVKTTSFGALTPFFASRREVMISEERSEQYRLYRLFKFRTTPKVFVLPGSLRLSCQLDPVQYRASIG